MIFSTLETRVRQNIEDVNSDYYSAVEVVAHINDAKDNVLSLVRIFTDKFPQATETITFAVGDEEKAMNANFLHLVRVESTGSGQTQPYHHDLINFQDIDAVNQYLAQQDLYIRRDSAGITYLGRRNSTLALTVTTYYITDVSDLTTASTASFSIGPPPADNLIIVKATISLKAARDRKPGMFAHREDQLTTQLNENLRSMNKTGPRYVSMPYYG